MRNIGRALALVAGASVLTGASAIAAPGAELRTEHSTSNVQTASGFTAGTFVLEHTGLAGDPAITSFVIDLEDGATAVPDLVFDPDDGTPAGDEAAKDFTLDAAPAGLTATPVYQDPFDDGFRRLEVALGGPSGGLLPGETLTFSIDVDPTSIAGSVGSVAAGPVSGAEMSGAEVEVTFAGPTTQTSRLAPSPTGTIGLNARAVLPVPAAIASRPTVTQFDQTPFPATVTTGSQQFLASAPAPGQSVRFFKIEGARALPVGDPSSGALNMFFANGQGTAPKTLSAGGFRAHTFLLSKGVGDTQTATGKNVVMAYLEAADGTPGPVSLPVRVELVAPTNLTPPSVSGTATEGQTLACDPGTWDPASPGVTYEWLRDGAPIAGAAGATYDLVQEDVGAAVSCRVTATGDGGSSSESSAPTGAVADAPPAGLTPPAVTGGAQVGGTLTCETGTWEPADAMLAVQWLRDDAPIPGATGATYSPTVGDLGAALSCRVTATGPGGETVATSAATSAVVAAPSGGTPSQPPAPTTPTTPTAPAVTPAPAVQAAARCAAPSAVASATSGSSTVTLSPAQLLINQRISQAAVRRANAVQARLDGGLGERDLCGGALTPAEFTGVTFAAGAVVASTPASPDPVRVVSAAGARAGGTVALTPEQLLINQRISQAAVRRLNALRARIDGGLTGGDLRDGAVTAGKLAPGIVVASVSPSTPVPATTTRVAPAPTGAGAGVEASVAQLRINQRISQAAVRRANDLIGKLETGFTGEDFQDGTLGGPDLGAALRG